MNVLIAGGSGHIGRHLTDNLQKRGYRVSWLTRKKVRGVFSEQFVWSYAENKFDLNALTDIDIVINLSGAPINGKRWTGSYKKEIYESRILGTRFLIQKINCIKNNIKLLINGSAIGYYGYEYYEGAIDESFKSGKDFLATTCMDWENETELLDSNIRKVIVRTGVVFNEGSEAYYNIVKPIKLNVGSVIGSGKQYFNWIHIEDLVNLFIYCIEQTNCQGVYNAVAPVNMNISEVTNIISSKLNKIIWLPNIPNWVVKLLIGELANSLLNGNKISVDKILNAKFNFKHTSL